jgi:hypothetical protein
MKLDSTKKANIIIENCLSIANDMALLEVELQARKILSQHKNLDEFVMGMGGWFFTRNDKEHTIVHNDSNGISPSERTPKYTRRLQTFIDKWDNDLKITGNPMRFTANGKTITDW